MVRNKQADVGVPPPEPARILGGTPLLYKEFFLSYIKSIIECLMIDAMHYIM